MEFSAVTCKWSTTSCLNLMTALGHQIGQFMARMKVEQERQMSADLQQALNNVKTLTGLLPICSTCKKVRDGKGYWNLIENYISTIPRR